MEPANLGKRVVLREALAYVCHAANEKAEGQRWWVTSLRHKRWDVQFVISFWHNLWDLGHIGLSVFCLSCLISKVVTMVSDSNQVSENEWGLIFKVCCAWRVQNVTSKEITLENTHPVKSSNTKFWICEASSNLNYLRSHRTVYTYNTTSCQIALGKVPLVDFYPREVA